VDLASDIRRTDHSFTANVPTAINTSQPPSAVLVGLSSPRVRVRLRLTVSLQMSRWPRIAKKSPKRENAFRFKGHVYNATTITCVGLFVLFGVHLNVSWQLAHSRIISVNSLRAVTSRLRLPSALLH